MRVLRAARSGGWDKALILMICRRGPTWRPTLRCLIERESPGSPRIFTSTAGLIRIVHASISSECWTRPDSKGYVFNVGIEPEFFLVVKNADGSIRGWDPHGVDRLHKPCYDFKGISGALDFLRALSDGLNGLGWGVYQTDHEDANFQYEVNFTYSDALTTADRLTFFRMMAGQLAQRAGAIVTFMAETILDSNRLRRPHALSSGRGNRRRQSVRGSSQTLEAWDSPRWPITSSAACSTMPRPCARLHRRRSTATSDSRWARLSPVRVRAIPGRRPSSPMVTITGRR